VPPQHRLYVFRKCQSKHTVDRLNPQPSVTSPLDQQILRRPVFVPSFRADYYRFARDTGTNPKQTRIRNTSLNKNQWTTTAKHWSPAEPSDSRSTQTVSANQRPVPDAFCVRSWRAY